MKKDFRNIILTFTLIAVVSFFGAEFYTRQEAQAARRQLVLENELALQDMVFGRRQEELVREAYIKEQNILQAEEVAKKAAEGAARKKLAAEEARALTAASSAAEAQAIREASAAEAARVAAAKNAADEAAKQQALAQAAEKAAQAQAAQKAADLAAKEAAKNNSRQSRAS